MTKPIKIDVLIDDVAIERESYHPRQLLASHKSNDGKRVLRDKTMTIQATEADRDKTRQAATILSLKFKRKVSENALYRIAAIAVAEKIIKDFDAN